MSPRNTLYRLAKKGERSKIYNMMESELGFRTKVRAPIVVAEREGKIAGFLGTLDRDDAVWAGPLAIRGAKHNEPGAGNPLMFIRLVEAYENVLRAAGIVSYFFTVAKGNQAQLARVQALGIPVAFDGETNVVFKRTM